MPGENRAGTGGGSDGPWAGLTPQQAGSGAAQRWPTASSHEASSTSGRPQVVIEGRYELLEPIGSGGMGEVWKAHDRRLRRFVAVKGLLDRNAVTPGSQAAAMRRARREAEAIAKIEHPNVVTVHDQVETDNQVWIVMKLLDAGSLADLLHEQKVLAVPRAADIGHQILQGLRAVHAASVLHRDVKPANVLVRDDGHVILVDFGIATFEGATPLTRSGSVIGTPPYQAPELFFGGPTPASDLWALGVTLYEMVEGRLPFDGREPWEVQASIERSPDPVLRYAGPLAPVIQGLLRTHPDERLDASTAEGMLREVLGAPSNAVPAGAAPQPPGPARAPEPAPAPHRSPHPHGAAPAPVPASEPASAPAPRAPPLPRPPGKGPRARLPEGREEGGRGGSRRDVADHRRLARGERIRLGPRHGREGQGRRCRRPGRPGWRRRGAGMGGVAEGPSPAEDRRQGRSARTEPEGEGRRGQGHVRGFRHRHGVQGRPWPGIPGQRRHVRRCHVREPGQPPEEEGGGSRHRLVHHEGKRRDRLRRPVLRGGPGIPGAHGLGETRGDQGRQLSADREGGGVHRQGLDLREGPSLPRLHLDEVAAQHLRDLPGAAAERKDEGLRGRLGRRRARGLRPVGHGQDAGHHGGHGGIRSGHALRNAGPEEEGVRGGGGDP
ncbi:serine/threonine protein kinase [Streptomyces pactum]|uniref:non-specific serine/threonine protein kinase n=1 Tax=Streptomyces pactum TaxID=68249 RepID=A0ABS0NDS1_9ACTN|nr:serine/threonine protein kinase [Streptomyces pactum]